LEKTADSENQKLDRVSGLVQREVDALKDALQSVKPLYKEQIVTAMSPWCQALMELDTAAKILEQMRHRVRIGGHHLLEVQK
jgi:hypothetical protein